MLLHALVKKVTVTTTGGKNEGDPVLKRGQIVLEMPDADDWQLDAISEAMDGTLHRIAFDEP